MAIIHLDQNTMTISVRIRHDEEFKPNEEINQIVEEAKVIKEELELVRKKMQAYLKKCVDWNYKNDTIFKETVDRSAKEQAREHMKKIKKK